MVRNLIGALLLSVCAAVLATSATAAPPLVKRPDAATALSWFSSSSIDGLAGSLRGYLAQNLSPVLYEASPGWGHQELVARGIKWEGLKPEVQYSHKNEGTWRKVKVTADSLPDTLIFDIRHLEQPEPGRLTFEVFAAFDAHAEYEHQVWRNGTRIYAAGTRARLRLKVKLQCEATSRSEKSDQLLPDLIFRLRVVHADARFDNLVVEHMAGIGGEGAKILGDLLKGSLEQWKPSLERDLLARLDAAMIKAGDTKDIRLRLSHILQAQSL